MVPEKRARMAPGVGDGPKFSRVMVTLNGMNWPRVAAPAPAVTPASRFLLNGKSTLMVPNGTGVTPVPNTSVAGLGGHAMIGPERNRSPGPAGSATYRLPSHPRGVGGSGAAG